MVILNCTSAMRTNYKILVVSMKQIDIKMSRNVAMLFKMIERFVFSGLSRNDCTNNLSQLKSSFFISVFTFCFVIGITGGSIKF